MAVEGIPSYDELKLRIGPGEGGAYQVVAFGPDGSTASQTFSLPFDETQLDNFVLRIGRPRRGVRAYRSSQMEDAKHFGSQLFDALISGAVHDVYLGARRVAEQNDKGLRVTLYLTDVPALMEVPWEFLYDRPAFLAQSIYTPVVRSLDLKTVRPPRKLTLPLRIVGMVSCPQGFDTLDVEREQRNLAKALAPLEREGMVELRWLERATLSALNEVVSSPEEVHVLHYIGHGAYDARTESGILVLENSDGHPHEVTGEELGSLLQDERSLRLVVLNSCEGARASHVDPFSGAASSLVECGIPAVVGMQFEITDEAAITFAGRLYEALVQGFPIDAALAQSRKAIFAAGNDTEFGTPVLFLRAGDARLFDPEQSTARPRPVPDRDPEPEPEPEERVEIGPIATEEH
ncbi:MAG: CHAT domain-containing protein, partial [Solirubrobacteraceae bacterium]